MGSVLILVGLVIGLIDLLGQLGGIHFNARRHGSG